MPRGYVHSGKNTDPEFRAERARKMAAGRAAPKNLLRRISGLTPEELAAGARALTPAEAAKIRPSLAVITAALPTEGADGSEGRRSRS